VDFVEYGFLYCVFCSTVKYASVTIFDLYYPHALTTNMLAKGVVEPAPKCFILFPFDYCEDVPFCVLVFSVLRSF
jgi:hypothetical protein